MTTCSTAHYNTNQHTTLQSASCFYSHAKLTDWVTCTVWEDYIRLMLKLKYYCCETPSCSWQRQSYKQNLNIQKETSNKIKLKKQNKDWRLCGSKDLLQDSLQQMTFL